MCPSSEEIFCEMKVWCSDHTPTRWWPCPIARILKKWHWTRSKASLCNNSLRNYDSIKTACRRGRKDSVLPISNLTTLERFLRFRWHFVYIVVGWVSSAAIIYRADIIFAADCREPSCSHRYQFISHNDVSNSLRVHFSLFIFLWKYM